jgi:flagellar operon protein
MIINNNMQNAIRQLENQTPSTNKTTQSIKQGSQNFQSIFNQQLEQAKELKFSKHANDRLMSRDIQLNKEQMVRLTKGVESARMKGVKESLMLMDNLALVVNIENSTVITALEKNDFKEHVFTNIDGAVLL